ncbi:hypothetical protein C4B63_267g25 [Trypanosoma cruzi]|uniref:GATOR2 complex protein MIO zinc-ribbon like domain-containing protein n=1 Tax=Trypanosoma cruzi TaxID=5693 RepID=A0A2V2UIY1_TRYCR|nr:hypothetical protein C4B63_267g25 [Trypanosoma cruzi]
MRGSLSSAPCLTWRVSSCASLTSFSSHRKQRPINGSMSDCGIQKYSSTRDVFFQPSLSSLPSFTSALSAKTDPLQHCALSYPLLATGRSHCSVCSSLVYLRSSCAQDSLAWCTACLHGGHANHLQEWFSTHRKCPVYGCSCRCEQVGTESYGEGGRAAFI